MPVSEKGRTKEWRVHSGFPLTLRQKPTNHKQACHKCGELMTRGEMQIKLRDGAWTREIGENDWNRGESYMSTFTHVSMDKGMMYSHGFPRFQAPRYLYFHTGCFWCILTKLMMEARVEIPSCERCPDRFVCFTDPDNIRCHRSPEYPDFHRVFRKTDFVQIERNGHRGVMRKNEHKQARRRANKKAVNTVL